MLALPGTLVTGIQFGPDGITVDVRLRGSRLRCPCGWTTNATYDTRPEPRRWRHLDLAGSRLWLRGRLRRLRCQPCGRVVTEAVPWARPKARFSRDYEDTVAWQAQRMDKTSVAKLVRCSWESVAAIVGRVVAEHINDTRLDNLLRIGVDEIAYRKGHRYLTVVADQDHDGAVVWIGEGKSAGTLNQFYDELGPERSAQLEAVSLDMGQAFVKATHAKASNATICFDPFHVVQMVNRALDETRRAAWSATRQKANLPARTPLGRAPQDPAAQALKKTRWALLKDQQNWTPDQAEKIATLRRMRHELYRAWDLKEDFRRIYRLTDGEDPATHFDAWLARACRSRIPAMVQLSRNIRKQRAGILAAIEHGLSNSRLEGLNSKTRLINHRGYGHHSVAALASMIYLCSGGITIELPTRT
jgi:transposase